MLKKRLEGSKGNWAEELHGLLWAYRTTHKTETQETPYALVYGAEAIIPTEMHVKTTVSGTTSQEKKPRANVAKSRPTRRKERNCPTEKMVLPTRSSQDLQQEGHNQNFSARRLGPATNIENNWETHPGMGRTLQDNRVTGSRGIQASRRQR